MRTHYVNDAMVALVEDLRAIFASAPPKDGWRQAGCCRHDRGGDGDGHGVDRCGRGSCDSGSDGSSRPRGSCDSKHRNNRTSDWAPRDSGGQKSRLTVEKRSKNRSGLAGSPGGGLSLSPPMDSVVRLITVAFQAGYVGFLPQCIRRCVGGG